MNTKSSYSIVNTPLGDILLVANESKLIGLYFEGQRHVPSSRTKWTHDPGHTVLQRASIQLREYLDGKRTEFSMPLHLEGTDFQQRVWRQISLIPFGETISYSDLAKKVGTPKAVRAAGTSTGRNPLSIFIPCHRVLRKNGGLGGFGGSLEWKRYLLSLEVKSEVVKAD